MRAALTLALALWPAAAMAGDWTGIWTGDPDWCRYADQIGMNDPAPIRITATRSEGLENACDIVSTVQIGALPAWHQRLACMGEGERYETERVLSLEGPDVLWMILDYGGAPVRFTRCPGTGG